MPTQGFKSGHDGRRRRGPKKGAVNAGRPREDHKEQIAALLASPECMGALESLLKFGAAKDPHLWLKAWSAAWDKVHAKPAQALEIEHSGEIDLVPKPPTYTVEQWAKLCSASRN